jgi:hypothetical protein
MRLSGALSANQATADALGALVDRKRRLGMVGINEDARPLIRLPQGAIQAAVLEVLADASGYLRAAEIHLRVETRLRQSNHARHGYKLLVGRVPINNVARDQG